MDRAKIDLMTDEEVVLEIGRAVLTNHRLLVGGGDARKGEAADEALLRDISNFQTVQGGQEGRLEEGLFAIGAGIVFVVIDIVVPGLPTALEAVFFLLGAIGILAGVYLIVGSIAGVKPHTTVIFQVPNASDISIRFPGRESPEAERLKRAFVRAKRGM